jgi:uncharacterized membrane protein required for colicin V production
MIWDFVVGYVLLTFAVSGWNLGLINSWRTMAASLAATLAAPAIYPNASAWVQEQSGLTADATVFFGYAMVWMTLTLIFEFILFILVPMHRYRNIVKWDKVGGAVVSTAKGLALLSFAMLASICAVDFPDPPISPDVAVWVSQTAAQSRCVSELRRLALRLPEPVIASVISLRAPTYHPNFDKPTSSPVDDERTRRFRALFNALHELERELDGY